MSDFIGALKKEHSEIKDALMKIDRTGHYNKEPRVEPMLFRDFSSNTWKRRKTFFFMNMKNCSCTKISPMIPEDNIFKIDFASSLK